MIEPIGSVTDIDPFLAQGMAAPQPQQADFLAWLNSEATRTNELMARADAQLRQLAAGENVPIHQVMMSIEEAKLAFQLVTTVRNKLLEGYQELMRMQI